MRGRQKIGKKIIIFLIDILLSYKILLSIDAPTFICLRVIQQSGHRNAVKINCVGTERKEQNAKKKKKEEGQIEERKKV